MEYSIFLDLALILFATKLLGFLFKRLGFPEVAGALIAGLLLGPNLLGIVGKNNIIDALAKIGVVMIMFTAGMETNFKQIKSLGSASIIITIMGVLVPFGMGFVIACMFNEGFNVPTEKLINNIYYGVILTATSVSITVATLELGKLSSKTGTAIISAAILDDIIGLVVLSYVISLKDNSVNSLQVLLNTLLFFVFAIVSGIIIHYVFKYFENFIRITDVCPYSA